MPFYTVPLSCSIKLGDLVGFSGQSRVSDVINVATYGLPRWGISHVGIIGDYQGRQLLIESTTLDKAPCEITHRLFNGTQAHDLGTAVENYQGRVWVYPLYRPLFDFEAKRLSEFLVGLIGTPYSEIGAIRSAGIGFSSFESLLHPENLSSIFCSELCAAALREIGIMPTDDAAKWNPNRLIRHLRRNGILLRPRRLK